MMVPFVVGIIGLLVSAWFAVSAIRELRRNVPGHGRNAAMIHIAMVSMLAPFCAIIVFVYAP
ncbi:MAG: hypothetical protein ACKO1N_07785 [Erythrobacter sp.]